MEWVPKRPEAILALKVCDPAMGSGSFLASALRYLTDVLVASLHHHKLIERAEDGGVPRMADGQISEVLSDELLKLNQEAKSAQVLMHHTEHLKQVENPAGLNDADIAIANHRSTTEDFDLLAREVVRIGNEVVKN